MKKVKKTKVKDTSKQSRLSVVLILAVVVFAALVYVSTQYFTLVNKIQNSNESVDVQLERTLKIASQSEKVIAGQIRFIPEIKKEVKSFENTLANQKMGRDGILSPIKNQNDIFAKIDPQWKLLKSSLNEIYNAKEAIENVHLLIPKMPALGAKVRTLAGDTQKALDNFQDTNNLTRALERLGVLAHDLGNLAGEVSSGGSEEADAAILAKIVKDLPIFLEVAAKTVSESERLGALAYTSPAGIKGMEVLKGELEQFSANLTSLTKLVPQYLKAEKAVDGIKVYSADIVTKVRELEEFYQEGRDRPIPAIPLSYLQMILGLSALAFGLLTFWAIMKNRQELALREEAVRLRYAAEEQNKAGQEAILRLMDELSNLADGDLTVQAQVTEDFTGAIADSVNFAVESMREMVGTITRTSGELSESARSTGDISRLLADSSVEQSKQIDFSSETAKRMSKSLKNIAQNTDSSVEIARSSVNIAQEGRERVLSTIDSMNDIRENIQETSKRIKRLGESSQEIGDIVEIIKSIADQTNVLALNAAIQATTAGEAGRGFAVVADEVQRLAERSANATKRIEVLVKAIQFDANEAVTSMESSTKGVVHGTGVAEEAGVSLDKIKNVSESLASLIVNVSQATRNAATMAGGVSTTMGKLTEINQKSVEEVTTAVQSIDNLRELSVSLKDSVSGFRLPN